VISGAKVDYAFAVISGLSFSLWSWLLLWYWWRMANHKQAKIGVEAARQAYLYGVGNGGIPLRDNVKLREIACVANTAFTGHLRKWESECEKMAKENVGSAYGLTVSVATSENHASDVHFLRLELDRVKSEVDNIDEIQADLWELVKDLQESSLASSEQIDGLITLIDRYLKKSVNRQNLLSLFLSLQKRWQDSSGMTGAIEASVAGMKEVEKVMRLENLRESHNPKALAEKSAPKHLADSSVFRR